MKPNIANPEVEEQLLLLKDLTRRLGVIHDAQAFQMKMWPLVLFTHAKQTEARVDIERKEIDYDILKAKGKPPEDIKTRFEQLDNWTKWMLGDEWVVRVKERGKLLYRGGRTIHVPGAD